MNSTVLIIEDPGPLTTVQDLGRYGFQDKGVPVSGAMDPAALCLGNLLAGNDPGEAALEVSLGGLRAAFLVRRTFAVTGVDPDIRLNGTPIPPWMRLTAEAGDTLTIDPGPSGYRHYLCVAGGIDVPVVLGSKSTYLRGGFGGYEGRPLRRNDRLRAGGSKRKGVSWIPPEFRPAYTEDPRLRVVLGPQADAFDQAGLETFLNATYRVSARSDRMGAMLEGPKITHRKAADIVSDGIALGAVQVPGEGLPFVLLADRPTTGGYTKIATVASFDVPLIAQLQPGRDVWFQAVSLWEAREVHVRRIHRLRRFVDKETANS